jgi:glycosyltransferase involved in cell wall biosynthesis
VGLNLNEAGTYPFVSIVIPAYNEEGSIGDCLDSVCNQDYPRERYEVILLDNGSSDSTREIAEKYPCEIYTYPKDRIGALRNRGIVHAKGDIVGFIDADCVAKPCWLISAVTELKETNTAAVGGKALRKSSAGWVERAWALDKELVRSPVSTLATGSFIAKKKVLEKVSGFNEKVMAGEDTELTQRLSDLNYTLILLPNCAVVHLGYPQTIKEFIKRQYWQTSDYWNTKKSGIDKTFLLTLIFVIFFGATLLTINRIDDSCFVVLLFFIHLAIPILSSSYRWIESSETFSISLMIKVFLLQYMYFLGRSSGLVMSTFKEIKHLTLRVLCRSH